MNNTSAEMGEVYTFKDSKNYKSGYEKGCEDTLNLLYNYFISLYNRNDSKIWDINKNKTYNFLLSWIDCAVNNDEVMQSFYDNEMYNIDMSYDIKTGEVIEMEVK